MEARLSIAVATQDTFKKEHSTGNLTKPSRVVAAVEPLIQQNPSLMRVNDTSPYSHISLYFFLHLIHFVSFVDWKEK